MTEIPASSGDSYLGSETVTLTVGEMERFLRVAEGWYSGDVEGMLSGFSYWVANSKDRSIKWLVDGTASGD